MYVLAEADLRRRLIEIQMLYDPTAGDTVPAVERAGRRHRLGRRGALTSALPVRSWARVLASRRAARDTFWMELDCPQVAARARAGQFVMLGTGLGDVAAPFLPRPFSIGAREADGRLGFLLRVFGAGTRRLSQVSPGDELLVLGPLGRPFQLSRG